MNEDLKATEAQIKQIEAAKVSAMKAKSRAEQCDGLGLGPLAREWDSISKSLEHAALLTLRMLKGNVPEGFQETPAIVEEIQASPVERKLELE